MSKIDTSSLKVGDKVKVKPDKRGQIICIVSPKGWGGKYYGVRYTDKRGDCDGEYKGKRFFYCEKGYGQYVKSSLIIEILSPGCNFDYLDESQKLIDAKNAKNAKYKTEKKNLQKLKQLFKDTDKDGNLTLDKKEFTKLAKTALKVDTDEAEKLFDSIDVSGNGNVSFAEFDSWLGNGGITKIEQYGKLTKAFKDADKDGNLTLDEDEFCKLALESMDLDEKNAKELFTQIDANKNGDICFAEFEAYIDDIGGLDNIKEFSKLKEHFKNADKDGSNGLELDEFVKLAKTKLNIPTYKSKKMFNKVDTNKNGSIQFDEFVKYVDKIGGIRKLSKDDEKEDVKESESDEFIKELGTTKIKLNDGTSIPVIGLGTYLEARAYRTLGFQKENKDAAKKEEKEFLDAIKYALKIGYRHIDSAQVYATESIIAQALEFADKNYGVKRKDVWITTKISRMIRDPKKVRESLDNSLKELKTDYIDMVLIHSPHSDSPKGKKGEDVIEQWKILSEYKKAGKIKSIGVSNFGLNHLKTLEKLKLETPSVNQIEISPFCQEFEIIKYCELKNIKLEAYTPISRGKDFAKNNKLLNEIANKKGDNITWASIMLKWALNKGYIILPKSVTPKRIKSNADLFGFNLTDDEMKKIDKLDLAEKGKTGQKHPGRVSWYPLEEPWDL